MSAVLVPSGWGYGPEASKPAPKIGRGWNISPAARALRAYGPDLLRVPHTVLTRDVMAQFGLTHDAAYSLVMRERLIALGGDE